MKTILTTMLALSMFQGSGRSKSMSNTRSARSKGKAGAAKRGHKAGTARGKAAVRKAKAEARRGRK